MKDSLLLNYNSKYKNILHRLITEDINEETLSYILDIGCGAGDDLDRISLINREKKLFGIDISFESLKVASRRLEKDCYLLMSYAETLPFKNESFDIIISSEVIEHINLVEEFLKEVFRVLKYQGVFIVTTPSRFNYTSLIGRIVPIPLKKPLRKLVFYLPQIEGNPHVHEYTPKELKKLFEKNGFIVQKIESGVLRVPIWPLFDKLPLLVLIWRCLDIFVGKLPFGTYLKFNFIILVRKMNGANK